MTLKHLKLLNEQKKHIVPKKLIINFYKNKIWSNLNF